MTFCGIITYVKGGILSGVQEWNFIKVNTECKQDREYLLLKHS
jgi:hypothetical protein